MPIAPPHRLAPTRHAAIRAALGATLLALTTAATGGEAEPRPEEPPADPAPEDSAARPGDVPAPVLEGTGAASANPAPPVAPQPTPPPPPAPPTGTPPIYTPGYPPPGYAPQPYNPGYPPSPYGPGYSPQGADTAWPAPPEPPGMNDATMFYASAVLMGIGCAMMTPLLLRLDIAGQLDVGDFPKLFGIYAGGALGYPLYLATTPLAMTGALPALAFDQKRRSDGALAAGIVLTMLGAAAAPLGAFFTSTAARSDFDPGPGIGLLVATGVGLGSGVPLMVWGAAPVEAQPPPPPYFGLRF